MNRPGVERVAELIAERNSVDTEIGAITGRPALAGHLGEWIAAQIFDIALESSAVAKGIDGRFTSAPLEGRTVNVKWYAKREGNLDLVEDSDADFYLVMTGPRAAPVSSRGGTRPLRITAVYLFAIPELLGELRARGVKIGVVASVRVGDWDAAEIYPRQVNRALVVSDEQREALELFGGEAEPGPASGPQRPAATASAAMPPKANDRPSGNAGGDYVVFRADDEGYMDWLAGHPAGYVVNAGAKPKTGLPQAAPRELPLHLWAASQRRRLDGAAVHQGVRRGHRSARALGARGRGHQELVRSAHLFADLPKAMIDPAFLDRLHYYLPGWEAPKLEKRLFTDHFGLVSDYFAEALRQLRKQSQVGALDRDFALGSHLSARDEKAVRKTVSGLLKILHPHGEWSHGELREYLEFAMEGRRRVKEQLKKLAGHDYAKTAFSYVEGDTGHEVWVDVPEQPDEFDPSAEEVVAGNASATAEPGVPGAAPEEMSTAELIARGESGRVEFKQTARINVATKQRDQVIELMVIKSVAGFMNAHGGTLLIGVTDRGEVFGIQKDLKTLGSKQNRDGFELWLTGLLDNTLGPTGTSRVSISYEDFSEGTVCRVDVTPGNKPTFVRGGNREADLYVRLNNSTRLLNTSDALDYVSSRWR